MSSSWERINSRAAQVAQSLPTWPEGERAAPNAILRSALFGALRSGPRRYIRKENVATVHGYDITYTGPQLDQRDLDVWMAILHVLREQCLDDVCRVTTYRLLKLLGQNDSGGVRGNRIALTTRIERLVATAVTISNGKGSYIGSLIVRAEKDNETQSWIIQVDPKVKSSLFGYDQFTRLDWQVRRSLTRHQLALWVYGFYQTHAKPYPYKVETLHKLAGGDNTCLRSFRQKLRNALDSVSRACRDNGITFKYEITDGKVFISNRKQNGSIRSKY